jgi:peptidyl-prolyl cis-trans isomerase D
VDDETLATSIRENAAFQVDGVFNADVYQSRLTSQNDTPQSFEVLMRADMVRDQFPENITSSAIATDWELNQYVALQNQERAFKAILLPATTDSETDSDETSENAPDLAAQEGDAETLAAETEQQIDEAVGTDAVEETEILAWYEAHPEQYRSEEQVTIEYLELNAANLEQDVPADDDMLMATFEDQKSRFITPEARLASHILIEATLDADAAIIETARQLAADLAERARAGEDFATLATENSQDAGSATIGGDLDWVEPGFMVQAFEDGLYQLSLENPVSDPVQSGFGWHVILLRDIRPAEGQTFEEARETLLTEYNTELLERKFIEQADRMVDIIYEDPTTLEAAASELDLTIETLGPFGRSGGEGIAQNADVTSAAFSDLTLQQGVVSDPVDLGENHIVMVRVAEHIPEDLLPLAEVRDSVIASVRQEQAMQLASERAESVLRQLQDGADIVLTAEEQSLELVQSEAATRNDRSLPAKLLEEIFLLDTPEEGSSRIEVVSTAQGYAVVHLETVTAGVLSEDDVILTQNFKNRIANGAANAEYVGFLRMLRAQSEVVVFEDRL